MQLHVVDVLEEVLKGVGGGGVRSGGGGGVRLGGGGC